MLFCSQELFTSPIYISSFYLCWFFILEILAELELTCLSPPDVFVHPFLLLSDRLKEKDFFFPLYSLTKEIQVLPVFQLRL